MNLIEFKIPDVGASDDIRVAEIYVNVGDIINKNDNVIMLETDKATMEVPINCSGVIREILVKVGNKVVINDIVMKIEVDAKDNSKVDLVSNVVNNGDKANSDYDLRCDVLVIGAGPGGYTAAFRASDLGKKVVLVEKYSTLGGVCLNVGCIPSKALLHVAKVINEANEMSLHGVAFGKPSLDIDKIREYKSGIVAKLTNGLKGLAKQRRVQVIHGVAKFNTRNIITVTDRGTETRIRFTNVIIATGSHSLKLPNIPYEDPRVIDSTGALNLEDIPKRMLVIGGGIIGLEMAEVYSTLGSEITIVELGDSIIPGADKDLVKVLENRVKKKFKAIYTKTKCESFESKKDGIYVVMNGANGTQKNIYDKILVCVGRCPNSKDLELDKIGVYVDERGFIAVDKECKTNIENIYAIGDVVGQPMLAHKATHEGKVAAENCAGLKSYFDARTIPSVAYTDPEIAWMGITEQDAKNNNLDIEIAKFPWAASGRALSNGRDDGLTKIIVDKGSKKVLGAGIVGVNAGELLAEAVLAKEMECDIHDVALTVHAHPTLSETLALACEIIDGSITDLYIPKK